MLEELSWIATGGSGEERTKGRRMRMGMGGKLNTSRWDSVWHDRLTHLLCHRRGEWSGLMLAWSRLDMIGLSRVHWTTVTVRVGVRWLWLRRWRRLSTQFLPRLTPVHLECRLQLSQCVMRVVGRG